MSSLVIQIPESHDVQIANSAPMSPSVLGDFQKGLAMMESGQAEEAVLALKRCVEQDPQFAAGHLCLGVAHAVSCNVYPAIDHLEKATELSPNDFAAHYTLAKFYFTIRACNKGYESAHRALDCAATREQRLALSQLLQKERERERNGIARPLFTRKFSLSFGLAGLSAVAGFIAIVLMHLR